MSMQHQPRPIISIQYSGYATCDTCSHTFYREQPGQTTCRLCQTSSAFYTKGSDISHKDFRQRKVGAS